jgi:hypothetical protein
MVSWALRNFKRFSYTVQNFKRFQNSKYFEGFVGTLRNIEKKIHQSLKIILKWSENGSVWYYVFSSGEFETKFQDSQEFLWGLQYLRQIVKPDIKLHVFIHE